MLAEPLNAPVTSRLPPPAMERFSVPEPAVIVLLPVPVTEIASAAGSRSDIAAAVAVYCDEVGASSFNDELVSVAAYDLIDVARLGTGVERRGSGVRPSERLPDHDAG